MMPDCTIVRTMDSIRLNPDLFALPRFGLLRFSGPDAQPFLHGQLTCDVAALKPGMSSYGGYCNPKGRLLATFLLWIDDEGCWMLLPAERVEPIRKRLSMYILRAKVKAEDMSQPFACAGIAGSNIAAQIEARGSTLPAGVHRLTATNGLRVIRLAADRCLLVMPRERATDLIAGDDFWAALDIAAGIPWIVEATQEEFVPQMVNLDLIGALSYSKGCYPGQEIVARTHYLGRLKQRMFRGRLTAPARTGDRLYCAELGEQAAGTIVSSAAVAEGHEVLAVLQLAQAASGHFRLGAPDGPPLFLLGLPYTVS